VCVGERRGPLARNGGRAPVGPDTDVVTITIGGNDVNFVGSLYAESCLADLAANPSSPTATALKRYGLCTPLPDETTLAALSTMESKLTHMVETVKAKAPKARIVMVDYPAVLPENGKPCSALPIPQERQKFLLQVAAELSNATMHAAQETGADFVAASRISRQHDACASTPWMTGYDFSPGVAAMHPNEAGHAAVAAAVIRQLTTPGIVT
jgi:lysophospholipase L1-like esterase